MGKFSKKEEKNFKGKQSKSKLINLFLAYGSKNNFNSMYHITKEAETKINDLYCFTCDLLVDGEDCLKINETRTKQLNFTKKCAQDEPYCSVRRFSYTMSDKNSTSDKKLWSLQRNCTSVCDNSCLLIGERVKIHACSSCCNANLCNISNDAKTTIPFLTFDHLVFFIVFAILSSS
jgi:hypothetical protein